MLKKNNEKINLKKTNKKLKELENFVEKNKLQNKSLKIILDNLYKSNNNN